ncbi:MAG: cob(I)yrinic acid a,c-diamide adenosyltransferase [Deltaproteobacteria bacterium]|jgi:cob(I)alamin adenosyltransferase|nr:cob(I)yrinic acid a,c-diamide adenosyltransferase [Deltaproteobacteria bacterium]MCL5880856.1 cob(I)yrinic acid a,c-diamide adenosyltransferase [Deltaproteobacteria bacterium]MDA8303760.1 cob(I)yrinic acid a,c-diamide adenosyltransferase [Deltaproteobacteria bacterium]
MNPNDNTGNTGDHKTNNKNLSVYNNWFKEISTRKALEVGLVQVYTGNGKGKTTAALGQALRASGHGLKSVIIQFLKGGSYSGEFKAIEKCSPLIKIYQVGRPFFIDKKNIPQKDIELNREGLTLAIDIATGKNDISILILDEINVALNLGIIKTKEVINLIKNKRPDIELILTGRNAPKEIIDIADLVTEMNEIKHYYSKNIPSRTGIEK